jgi:8-oxo-dGTP diphosphatase
MGMREKPFYLAVAAIIRDGQGRILLLKRSDDDSINPGKWDLPGGKIDKGETFDQALVREVREESGLAVGLCHVAGAGELELPDKRIAYLILECTAESGDVSLSPEHSVYCWIDPTEAAVLDLAPQYRDLFSMYSLEGAGSRPD